MALISPVQIVIIIFALFALSRTILRFRDSRVSGRGLVLWGILWIGAIVIAIIPDISKYMAESVGIGRGVDLFIYLSIMLLFYLLFRIYVRVESLDHNLSKIVSRIAIDEASRTKEKSK